ncbi:MAG: N-formylglutamate amidohydrolase [Flavobacteriaceae bacterium]|nr:N-formylglutamate amidohydrolase [Flavobacteriaceae bacterium]
MIKLGISEIIQKISNRESFTAVSEDYSFVIKIEDYVPLVCGAVHDGHHFPKDLWVNCTHSAYERWYEEDPCTANFIAKSPIVIKGLESRFAYDLNRAPDDAVYETAWGKSLWKTPLEKTRKSALLRRHHTFYEVCLHLINVLEKDFGGCLVIDMHSYNIKRWDRPVPTFNIGTKNIDEAIFASYIDQWRNLMAAFTLPDNIASTAHINDVFQGNGYFLKNITQNSHNTLVLATEVGKVYCDENHQIIFPEVVHSLQQNFTFAINQLYHSFVEHL